MKTMLKLWILPVMLYGCYSTNHSTITDSYSLYKANYNIVLYQNIITDSVLCKIPKGDPLIVLNTKNYYHYVKYKTSAGQELYGWTSLDSLKYISRSTKKAFGSPPGNSTVTTNSSSSPSTTLHSVYRTDSVTTQSSSSGGSVNVRGYYRKDGTYVRPYTRRAPTRH